MTAEQLDALAALGRRMTHLEEQVNDQGRLLTRVSGKLSLVAIDQAEQMDSVIDTLERICNHLGVQSAMKRRGREHPRPSQAEDAPTAE